MVKNWLVRVCFVAVTAVAVLAFGQTAFASDPSAGQAVYTKSSCGACHGAKGEGALGPALSGAAFAGKYATPDKLAEVIRKGTSKGMPPYAEDKLSKSDLESLVAFIQSLSQATGSSPSKAEPATAKAPASQAAVSANASAGQAVYEKNACAACHGPRGEGAMGPALSGAEFTREYATTDKLMDVVRKGSGKVMSPFGEDKISQADMENLVAYLRTFSPAASSASTKAEPTTAKAPAEAKTAAKTSPSESTQAGQAAESTVEGFTFAQKYFSVVAALAVLMLLVFAVVLKGPLRSAR